MIFLYRICKIFFVYYYYLWILSLFRLLNFDTLPGFVPTLGSSNFYGTVRYLPTYLVLISSSSGLNGANFLSRRYPIYLPMSI